MGHSYLLHGLGITSDLPLCRAEDVLAGPPDLEVVLREPAPQLPRALDADVELTYRRADLLVYEAWQDEGRWLVDVPHLVRFEATPSTLIVHPTPVAPADFIPVLVMGTGLAFVLELRQHLVLHASAIDIGGEVVAFAGLSGAGKSTLAGLGALGGMPVFAEDLLRVDVADPVVAHRGAGELRLRPAAEWLATAIGGGSPSPTVDGRLAVVSNPPSALRLPLSAVVLPVLDRARSVLAIERLDAPSALRALLDSLRLLGWLNPSVVARQFGQLADLVERVPVFLGLLPWGEPDAGLVVDVVDRIRAQATS